MSGMFKEIKFTQPKTFEFTKENLKKVQQIIDKYPKGQQQSAVMPLLELAQRQHDNWIPIAAMDYIANLLEMPMMRVYEVATFYTLFELKPVGKHKISVCTNISCMLSGCDKIVSHLKKRLEVDFDGTSADGKFTLR